MVVTDNTLSLVSLVTVSNLITIIINITAVHPFCPPTFKMWTMMIENDIIQLLPNKIWYMYKLLKYVNFTDVINRIFVIFYARIVFPSSFPIKTFCSFCAPSLSMIACVAWLRISHITSMTFNQEVHV